MKGGSIIVETRRLRNNKENRFEQYEIINSTYDQQMAAIQTVIIINITITSAILIVLCSELRTIEMVFNNETFNIYSVVSSFVLSLVGLLESLLCLNSIKIQNEACEKLRLVLLNIEKEFKIVKIHEKNRLENSIKYTTIGSWVTVIVFALFCGITLKGVLCYYTCK